MIRKRAPAHVIVLAALGTIACSQDSPPPPDAIKIGALWAFTGSLATKGIPRAQAIDLAVAEINAQGGVLGRPLRVVNQDETDDIGVTVTRAHDLVDREGVVALIGPEASAPSVKVLQDVTSKAMPPGTASPIGNGGRLRTGPRSRVSRRRGG